MKFERNRTIRGRVIEDLAHFRRQIFNGVPCTQKILRDAWTDFTKLGQDTGPSFMLTGLVSDLAAFSNAGR